MLTEFVSLQLQLDLLDEAVQEEHGLPPRGVQLVPLHGNARQPPQPEPVDGAEVSRVPDVEGGVKHVGLLQLVQLRLVIPEKNMQLLKIFFGTFNKYFYK